MRSGCRFGTVWGRYVRRSLQEIATLCQMSEGDLHARILWLSQAGRVRDERLTLPSIDHHDLLGGNALAQEFVAHGICATSRQCHIVGGVADVVAWSSHLDN